MKEFKRWTERCNSHGCENVWEYGIDDGRVYVALIHKDGTRTHQTWLPPMLMGYLADFVQDNVCKIIKYEEARAVAIATQDLSKFIEEAEKEDIMIRLNGKSFRCDCGGNVFKRNGKLDDTSEIVYRCNSCGEEYAGQMKDEVDTKPKMSSLMKGIQCQYMIYFDKGGQEHVHCEHDKLPCPFIGNIKGCKRTGDDNE